MKPDLTILILLNILAAILVQESQAQTWSARSINQREAQALTKKSEPLTVAVIDTGADVAHPFLRGHLWRNPGETGLDKNGRDKSTNGVDDDGNGFVDDVTGWNFAGDNPDLADHHGHGTHIAGIIGGIAPDARLMIVKYYDPRAPGSENLSNLIKALRYAIRMRARIINYSGGGFTADAQEKQTLLEAQKNGILVVAAAGNEGQNSDQKPFYPADYRLPNLLSVTAHDPAFQILDSSNYGTKTVDLAAPGEAIRSSLPRGQYGEMTGTSQATAFVSAAAALLVAQRPDLQDPREIIQRLLASTRYEAPLSGKTATSGSLDLLRTLSMQDGSRSFSGYRILDSAQRSGARLGSVFPLK